MHVQIAQNVQNARAREVKEAAVRQQQQDVKSADAALLAQQQALAAGQRQAPQPPHCLPSTSGAPPPGYVEIPLSPLKSATSPSRSCVTTWPNIDIIFFV